VLDAVLRLAAFGSASFTALGRFFRMVLPLPVLVFGDFGRNSFLDSRGRNLSFDAFFIIRTVIARVLVTFQICRLHSAIAIETFFWGGRSEA
jgi:hypothetical protein